MMDDTKYWKLEFVANGTSVSWITKTNDALLKCALEHNADILFLGGHHKMWDYSQDQLCWILAGGIFKAHLLYDPMSQTYSDFRQTETEPVDESQLEEVTRVGNGFAFHIWKA